MKLKKHWHFIVALLGIIILNEIIYSFKPSPPVEFVSNIIIGIGIIAVIVAWIIFGIKKIKNKNLSVNSQVQTEHASFNYKLTFRFWLMLSGIVLLLISFGQKAGKRTLEDIANQHASSFPTFYLSSSLIQFIQIYIFFISLYFAFLKYRASKLDATFLFIVSAVLFNPFISFHFETSFLNIVKLLAIALFGYFAYRECKFSD